MRPSVLNPLFADVTSLKGVGPRLAALVTKAAGPRVVDVLFTRPHGVIDRSRRPKIADAEVGSLATLEVRVDKHHPPAIKRLPYKVICSDDTGFVTLIFFHARPDYLARALPEGAMRVISGRIEDYGGSRQMTHPDHIVDPTAEGGLPLFEPVYPLTAGLPPSVMRKATQGAVERTPKLPEWQDAAWLKKNRSPSWNEAIRAVHAPSSAGDFRQHRRRSSASPMTSCSRTSSRSPSSAAPARKQPDAASPRKARCARRRSPRSPSS